MNLDFMQKQAAIKFAAGEDLTSEESAALRALLIQQALTAPSVTKAVLGVLNFPSESARLAMTEMLGDTPGPLPVEITQKLQELAIEDSDPMVRQSALHALLKRDE